MTDPRYPPALRDIFDPPPLLFARGRVELLATLMLGVVGTRRPTAYGGVAASKLSADLAAAGMTIASGMARGIDTAAHRGVLEAGGDTVAVFGSGIDQIYPAENRKLAEEIADARAADLGIPDGRAGLSAELSHPQPDHQRYERRSPGG